MSPQSWDPDLDLESGVLRNRLKIRDQDQLAVAEARLSAIRMFEIERDPIRGKFDLPHLQNLHFTIFGDIYFFSGQIRIVNLAKNRDMFCPPEQIADRAREIFDERTDPDHLRTLDRSGVLDSLAGLLNDMNRLHPFREGNGRSTRMLLTLLGREAGWQITWAGMDRDRNREAAQAGYAGDIGPLRALLDERLTPIEPRQSPPAPRQPR